jgi:hypothetical protein
MSGTERCPIEVRRTAFLSLPEYSDIPHLQNSEFVFN